MLVNLAIVLILTTSSVLPSDLKRFTYNSSDLSYLSNGIQFPVPASDGGQSDGGNVENANALQLQDRSLEVDDGEIVDSEILWFSRLYDHFYWRKTVQSVNGSRCRDHMEVYLDELNNGTSWAGKMYDASGRYSGHFFFGNDYWLGSKALCDELINVETNAEVPPFPVNFFVAKVRVNINAKLTPVTRQLNVGECLPSSCNLGDVRFLLSQDRKMGVSLNVVGVRTVPGEYEVLQDIKFQIIGGFSIAVAILVAVASLVEHIMATSAKNRIKHKRGDAEMENNNNNNNGQTMAENTKESISSNNVNNHIKQVKKHVMEKRPALPLRILLCFSAISNGKKILNVSGVAEGSIQCIHGLRFFSIAWIIMVHTYLELFAIADNKNMRIVTERSFMYQTVSNATFSVDTFFFISGLLVTITYFRTAAKKSKRLEDENKVKPVKSTIVDAKDSVLKFLVLIIYRFFRLTPAYLFVLGVNEVMMRYLHSYSVFSPAIIDHISCSNFWWRNALYINNFYPQTEFCMLWSWYIANDTQFYLIAAILLLIAVRGEKCLKFAGISLGIFLVASWVMTFIIATKHQYTVRVEEPFALFDQLYDKPWMRIGPYFIGMLAGYFMFRVDCKVRLSPLVVILGWTLSLSCLASLVYGVGRDGLTLPLSAFYAALGHTAWGLSLAWITLACCSGYGGPLDSLFKFRMFLPLSRLTYCAYLVHPVLMCLTSFVIDGPLHLHQALVMVIYCGNIIFSFGTAFAITLGFEAPIVNLLKIFF